MRVVGGAADQVLVDLEGEAAIAGEPVNHLADLEHHFGADAVTGQDQQFNGRHWSHSGHNFARGFVRSRGEWQGPAAQWW